MRTSSFFGSLSTGALTALAAGCGVAVGLIDVAGIIVSQAIYGNSVEKEQDGDTQPTGPGDIQPTDPALNGREGPPSPSASVASSSIGASRGYLVHILIAGSPGVGKTTVAKAYLSGALPVAVQSEETLFKTMVVDDFKAHVQIWEKELLPEGEHSMVDRKPVCGVILVYSTQHPHTFEDLQTYYASLNSEVSHACASGIQVLAILGNILPLENEVKDLSSLKCEATLLQSVDIFAEEHGLPHFLMDAPDDLLTLTDAFHQVVSGGLKNVVAKAEELRERRECLPGKREIQSVEKRPSPLGPSA